MRRGICYLEALCVPLYGRTAQPFCVGLVFDFYEVTSYSQSFMTVYPHAQSVVLSRVSVNHHYQPDCPRVNKVYNARGCIVSLGCQEAVSHIIDFGACESLK